MVITVPRMGNTYLGAKALFEGLHIPYVMPHTNNKTTLLTGAYVSPEEICLPFKIMMGNFIECIERGADTILITGSCGPCRFGEYCELQMKILKRLRFQINTIVIDSPREIGKEAFWSRIAMVSSASHVSKAEKLKVLWQAMHIVALADEIDAKAHWLAGYEANKGQCKRLLRECKSKANKCKDPIKTQKVLEEYKQQICHIPIDKTQHPIKIALIGEIYSMIEPFSNLYIEDKLMDYGVCTTRLLTPSWWTKDLLLKPVKLNSLSINNAAKTYLPFNVGGHAKESIGHAVLSHHHMDGAIQIFPMGCMPEIITKAILPTIQKKEDFPIMTLIVDEMIGEAGYVTRIEAFLDMLETRKKKEVMMA